MGLRRRWSPQKVIQSIQERQELGLPINAAAVVVDDESLYGAARRHLGGWRNALKAAGVGSDASQVARSLPRGTWSREVVVDEIQRHAASGHELAAHRMQKINSRLVAAATHHFGSWQEAVTAAGFDYQAIRLTREWSAQRILGRLQELDRAGANLTYASAQAWDTGLVGAAEVEFGTWQQALMAAGVKKRRRTRKWTRDEILVALGDVTTRRKAPEGLRKAAKREFGSWNEALLAAGVGSDSSGDIKVRCMARDVRTQLGLSLAEVGERMGCSGRWLSQLELGQVHNPRVGWALRWAQALGVSVVEIFQLE